MEAANRLPEGRRKQMIEKEAEEFEARKVAEREAYEESQFLLLLPREVSFLQISILIATR